MYKVVKRRREEKGKSESLRKRKYVIVGKEDIIFFDEKGNISSYLRWSGDQNVNMNMKIYLRYPQDAAKIWSGYGQDKAKKCLRYAQYIAKLWPPKIGQNVAGRKWNRLYPLCAVGIEGLPIWKHVLNWKYMAGYKVLLLVEENFSFVHFHVVCIDIIEYFDIHWIAAHALILPTSPVDWWFFPSAHQLVFTTPHALSSLLSKILKFKHLWIGRCF